MMLLQKGDWLAASLDKLLKRIFGERACPLFCNGPQVTLYLQPSITECNQGCKLHNKKSRSKRRTKKTLSEPLFCLTFL